MRNSGRGTDQFYNGPCLPRCKIRTRQESRIVNDCLLDTCSTTSRLLCNQKQTASARCSAFPLLTSLSYKVGCYRRVERKHNAKRSLLQERRSERESTAEGRVGHNSKKLCSCLFARQASCQVIVSTAVVSMSKNGLLLIYKVLPILQHSACAFNLTNTQCK